MKPIMACIAALLMIPFAVGIGVSPPRIEAEHMARGSHFEQEFYVSGLAPGDTVSMSVEGQVKDWISFDPAESFVFSGESSMVPVRVSIDVPPDAANGLYHATARISGHTDADSGTEENYVSVVSGVQMNFTVSVTGEEVREYSVSSITIGKSEVGQMLPLMIKIVNRGNVVVHPSILELTLFDKYRATELLRVNLTELGSVPPHNEGTILVQVPHDLAPDEYWASVRIMEGARIIYQDEMMLEVVARGMLAVKGELVSVQGPDEIRKGSVMKLTAWFNNTGEVPVKARFVGELHDEAGLVGVLESEELTVAAKRHENLVAYVTPEKAGWYWVTGHVVYEGKKTSSRELGFTVKGSAAITLILAGAALLVTIAVITIRRQKRK
jgi:hypothetical protein